MKIKNVLLAGLALIGLAACSNEDQLESETSKAGGETAYTSFTINLADNILTRAGENPELGTAQENQIKTMRVVLYAGGKVAHVEDFAIRSDGESTIEGGGLSKETTVTNKVNGFVTSSIEVKKQDYQVAVILNATPDVVGITDSGTPLGELDKALSNVSAADFSSEENGFMMSNAQGLVTLLASELYDSKESAEQNPLKVQVDRVVAKLQVLAKLEANDNAKVEAKGWIADVTNKHTFPLRHLAPQVGGSYEVVDHKNPQNSTSRTFRYAKDPNFEGIDLVGKTHEERMKTLEEEFDYYRLPTFGDASENSEVHALETDYAYVLENTFDGGKENVLQSQATRVVLKASYVPNALNLPEGKQSWVSYSGVAMTPEDFEKKALEALKLGWNESVDGLTPSFTNEIKNLVFLSAYLKRESTSNEEVEKYKYLDIVEFKDVEQLHNLIDKASPNEGEKILNIKLTADQIESIGIRFMVGDDDEPFAVGNLNYYKGGDNYYPLYIKHFEGLDGSKSVYGKYGVVRNNFYRVTVTNIERPGSPIVTPPVGPEKPSVPTTPTDPKDPKPEPENPDEPDKPIDAEEIYVAFEVDILPWVVRDQSEKID